MFKKFLLATAIAVTTLTAQAGPAAGSSVLLSSPNIESLGSSCIITAINAHQTRGKASMVMLNARQVASVEIAADPTDENSRLVILITADNRGYAMALTMDKVAQLGGGFSGCLGK